MIKKDKLVKVLCNKWGCNWVRQKKYGYPPGGWREDVSCLAEKL